MVKMERQSHDSVESTKDLHSLMKSFWNVYHIPDTMSNVELQWISQ